MELGLLGSTGRNSHASNAIWLWGGRWIGATASLESLSLKTLSLESLGGVA